MDLLLRPSIVKTVDWYFGTVHPLIKEPVHVPLEMFLNDLLEIISGDYLTSIRTHIIFRHFYEPHITFPVVVEKHHP